MSDWEPLFSDWDRETYHDRPTGLTDLRQTRRIFALEDELASARAAHRRSAHQLRAQLSEVTGSLEQRIDRLSAAFDAFVELTDVRERLAVYDTAALVRLRAKQVIVGVGGGDAAVPDVPGYWLVPALRALHAWRAGRDAASLLAEAAAIDVQRAALFHALTCAQFGRGATVSGERLGTAFGSVGEDVTLAQRALWTLAADGHYGPAGQDVVQDRLSEPVAALPEDGREEQIAKWCTAVRLEASSRTLPTEQQGRRLAAILEAGDRLEVLRGWLAEVLAERPERTAEPDDTVRTALELLVDEGSPAEAALLARERELRRVIDGSQERALTWDHPVGKPVAMLTADVEDAEHPERAAMAIRACGPLVLAAAERLAAQAAEPVAGELKVRTRRGGVTVTRSGPDQATVDRSVAGLATYEMQRNSRRQQACWALAVTAGFVALGFAAWIFFVLAVIPAGVAVWMFSADAKARTQATQLERTTRAAVLAEAQEQARLFAAARAEIDKRRPGLQDDVTTVKSLLG